MRVKKETKNGEKYTVGGMNKSAVVTQRAV